ncbi:MAG: hypothetical protein ACTHM9_05020 [Gemmatimonadales bacterium]
MAHRPPRDLHRLALATGVILASACSHTDPPTAPPYTTDQPLDPTPPARLTFNVGADREPSWLPDGTGILYSTQQLGRGDADVCLAELPPTGGSQRRLVCDAGGSAATVGNGTEWAVVGPDGALAFVRASWTIGGTNPASESVAVAPSLDPLTASDVQHIPYTIPGEPQHSGIQDLRWVGAGVLVFVGGQVDYRPSCFGCAAVDTTVRGLKVATLDITQAGNGPVALPGTDFASGVSGGTSSDEIFFTVAGDSRVFRRTLSTGETAVAHDFGGAGIARDVDVAGGRLTAIVGGRVGFALDPQLGAFQSDSGGIVHVVDLGSGADVALEPGAQLYRHPALSPADGRVVAEGYALVITGNDSGIPDTTVSPASDLYLFAAP